MTNMSGVSHNLAIESGEGGATPKGSSLGASQFITKGSTSITVKLKAWRLHLLLPGSWPPRGRHVRHAHSEVGARRR